MNSKDDAGMYVCIILMLSLVLMLIGASLFVLWLIFSYIGFEIFGIMEWF